MTEISTYISYHVRSSQLWTRAARELELKDNKFPDAEDFVNWLISLKPKLGKSTWRQYKAATLYALSTLCDEVDTEVIEKLKLESQSGALKRCHRTSAIKIKKVPPHDLLSILNWLSDNKARYSKPLQLFLMATIITGLRPIEWEHAHLLGDDKSASKLRLIVINAKATDNRGNGKKRTLFLDDTPDYYLDVITTFLQWIKTKRPDTKWSSIQASLARRLARANAALWPKRKKHYTLYSCRHQAAANFKCVFTRAEVAALLGQASDETATCHYARSSSGSEYLLPDYNLVLPRPCQNEVAQVRPRYSKRIKKAHIAWDNKASSPASPAPSP